MSSWKDIKDQGPWDFSPQPDKWGYLNNPTWTNPSCEPLEFTPETEPQVWDIYANTGDADDSITHVPCGHWHKKETGDEVITTDKVIELYYEFLHAVSTNPRNSGFSEIYSIGTSVPLKISNIDGNKTWILEVLAANRHDFDVEVVLHDYDENEYCSVTITAGTYDENDYCVYRFTGEVSNLTEDKVYYIKLRVPEGEYLSSWPYTFYITNIRLILKQENATKTYLQIPMFSNYANATFINGDDVNPDNKYYTDTGSWFYECEFSKNISWKYGEPVHSFGKTAVWKYDSNELSNVSESKFCVVTRGAEDLYSNTKILYMSATSDILHFHFLIYYINNYTGYTENGDPYYYVDEYTSHVGLISGYTYTPIPNTLYYWQGTPYPYEQTVTSNISHLTAGTYYIALGGEFHYIGVPENRWFGLSNNTLKITIPANYIGNQLKVTYKSVSTNQVSITITYDYKPVLNSDKKICLYDLTDDKVVDNSIITIENGTYLHEKSVTLESGHEYTIRYYNLDEEFKYYAEIISANIYLTIDKIVKLTTWRKCLMLYDVTPPYPENGWGLSECYNYTGIYSPHHRAMPYFNDSDEIYFECSAICYYEGQDPNEDPQCKKIGLILLKGDGSNASDAEKVDGSEIDFSDLGDGNYFARRRSDKLSLENGKIYGNYRTGRAYYLAEGVMGFIVTKIK